METLHVYHARVLLRSLASQRRMRRSWAVSLLPSRCYPVSEQRRNLSWMPRKEVRTIPNMITAARIVASPLLGYAVASDMKISALAGCLVFGFTDWLDGYLAKRLNQQTALGAFLDPLADKMMVFSLSAGLVYQGLLPCPLFALFMTKDVTMIAAVFILRSMEKPTDADFFDTIDTSTFQVVPSDISKINTALQFGLLGLTLSHFAFHIPTVHALEPWWWITATTTLWSGLGYLDGSGIRRIRGQGGSHMREDKDSAKPLAKGDEAPYK